MNGVPTWAWLSFALLAVDLSVHRGERADSRRTAFIWSGIWIGVGLAFNGFVWFMWGSDPAQEYLAAYLIEKSLSLDNLFVFLVIFRSLNIPHRYQRTVLTWGIFGALVFRALFVFAGAAAIARWHWVSYAFGAILLYAAWRVFREDPTAERRSRTAAWLSRHLPVTETIRGHEFVIREGGRRVATPLAIALVAVELTDIMFAVDSVPAAFSITRSEFLVYSSNAFAILGLRSLYIALSASLERLSYLHYGLALVLAFAGLKIALVDVIHIPPWLSIAVIVAIIGTSIAASLRKP